MKKLICSVLVASFALAVSTPSFAQDGEKKSSTSTSTTNNKKKTTCTTTKNGGSCCQKKKVETKSIEIK